MGSLPNLRELVDGSIEHRCFTHRRHVKCHHHQVRCHPQVRGCSSTSTHCGISNHHCGTSSTHCGISNTHCGIRNTRSVGNYNTVNADIRIDKCNHFFTTEVDVLAYSPASNRSIRSCCTIHHSINNQLLLRRSSKQQHRDSMSSSGGASSVKRLIAIVRSTPSKTGPIYSRRLLFRNFAALCLTHTMITAAFIPLYTLQGSLSIWWLQPEMSNVSQVFRPNFEIGSILLTSLFSIGALSALASLFLVNRFGTIWSLIFSYCGTCIFIGLHLYPNAYTLIPAYLFMGMWLGPLVAGRITCLMELSNKLSFVMTEQEMGEVACSQGLRRTEIVVHKLSRGLQVAQDFGFIIGNMATSLLIWYTTKHETTEALLDLMFSIDSNGERICGSAVCPQPLNFDSLKHSYEKFNNTLEIPYQLLGVSCRTNTILISVFLGFCVMGVAVTATFMDHIKVSVQKEIPLRAACCSTFRLITGTFKDYRIQLIAPLLVFIGLEQGFMYTAFSKSYVACALGVKNISLVFLSLGVLQSIAAFTLSMLLQHIRRHLIIAVGFIFQSCLLLVLMIWKPSKDDPALFYVVPAAWGVCNAIWDTLSFTLIVSVYPDTWQAPFAHCYFFRYLGLAITFGIHNFFCNSVKLYGLTAAMIIAIVPYTWLEVRHEARRRLKLQMAAL
ncbi:hypothetical protein GE061_001015 [Apolygus lucorum]|uniref:UNC93-like protein n=1 Tax=Apolygus lucorum TaxID=248454 RepID=A0A6A4KCI0_APOLU|nr:hypothetical protein GE061_001015 [Apolygus lucorum]